MRHLTLAALLLSASLAIPFSAPSVAGVLVQQPVWYVELTCKGYKQCYAAGNSSYTGSFSGARKFTDQAQADRFFNSLTSSVQKKSPRLRQGMAPLCIKGESNDPNAKPC
ncbi:hypothetical protein [Atopomonas hussainii]|uniref:hypothetical protein n=1 Tax=Atopomonas hussainii TaxID=1429083 RepID=UPI0008FFEA1A|nr:hypothetical protein [Atopomonas hussainii]